MAVLQIVRFRPRPDVDGARMREVNERFQREVTPTLPGLERREGTVGEDGDEWTLVLRYRDMDSATRGPQADTGPIAREFMSLIDMASMSATFHTVVSE